LELRFQSDSDAKPNHSLGKPYRDNSEVALQPQKKVIVGHPHKCLVITSHREVQFAFDRKSAARTINHGNQLWVSRLPVPGIERPIIERDGDTPRSYFQCRGDGLQPAWLNNVIGITERNKRCLAHLDP